MMSRVEQMLMALLNDSSSDLIPKSRIEEYLDNCVDGDGTEGLPPPKSRVGILLYQLAEKLKGGVVVGDAEGQTYLLLDESGNEVLAALVDEDVNLTATEDDIREGATAVTEAGVTTGTKVIPSYHTTEGARVIRPGRAFEIVFDDELYDFTKLQAIICPYAGGLASSVAAEKVAIEDGVYPANSTELLATVSRDSKNKSINLGIVNNSDSMYLLRFFTYKEIN